MKWPVDITKYCKLFFVPCEENSYKPKSLEGRSFFVLLVVILAIKFLGIASYIEFIGADIYNQIAQADIYALTNKVRQENGVGVLKASSTLELSAQLKIQDMIQAGYFAHESPTGKSPWHWFDKAKYSYASAGENLAMNFISSKEVVDAWLNSETHKRNLLYKDFTDIGVAIAKGVINNQETIVVVQHFAKPLVASSTRAVSAKPIVVKATPLPKKVATIKPSPIIQKTVSITPIPSPTPTPKLNPISLKQVALKVKGAVTIPEDVVIANNAYIINSILHNLLIMIGIFTGLLLVLKIFIAIRIQYPVLIMRGLVLMLLCWSLVYVKDYQFLPGSIQTGTASVIYINN